MNLKSIANHFMTTISLITALGVFTHDGRVDKAATTALSSSAVKYGSPAVRPLQARMSDFASSNAHTHPDHNAANRALMSSFFYQSPSIAPRRRSHHKELKRMLENPPRHAFDNTNLPILA